MFILYDYIAGAVGGICGLFISHPFDTVKVTLQLETSKDKKTVYETIKQVAKGGLRNGIYRGLGFPLCSAAFQNSLFFGTYGYVSSLLSNSQFEILAEEDKHTKNYFHIYLAGTLAGIAQAPLICPPDRIKVVLQSQIHDLAIQKSGQVVSVSEKLPQMEVIARKRLYFYGPCEASLWLYQRYGWRGAFYRGFECVVLRDSHGFGVYILAYELIKDRISENLGNTRKGEITSILFGGATAGSISWMFSIPFDVLKNVYQSDITHKYRSSWHCAGQLYREFGLRIFYRGISVVSLQALPVNAVIFLAYSQSLKVFQARHSNNRVD